MALKKQSGELITSKSLRLQQHSLDFLVIVHHISRRNISNFLQLFRHSILYHLKDTSFLQVGCDKKLSTSPSCIIISLEIVSLANSNIFRLTLHYDKCILPFSFILLISPDNNICTSSTLPALRVCHLYFFSHLFDAIAVAIHQTTNVSLANFLLRL